MLHSGPLKQVRLEVLFKSKVAEFGCLYCSASVPRLDSSLAIFWSLPTLFEDSSNLFRFSILPAIIFPILAGILFDSACFYHRLLHSYFTSTCPCGLVIFARIPPRFCFERGEPSGTCPPYFNATLQPASRFQP